MTAIPPRSMYPVNEARRLLGDIGRTGFYAAVKDGRIQVIKFGKRTFVSAAEIERITHGGLGACPS